MESKNFSADDKNKLVTALVGLGSVVLTTLLNSVIKADDEKG